MLRDRCQFPFLIATLLLLQAACLTNSQTSGSSQVAGRFRLERPNILADGNDLTQLTLLAYQRDSQKPIPGAAVTWLVKGCQSEQAEERTDAEGTARLTLKSEEPGACTVEAQITVGEASLTLEQSATVLVYTMPKTGIVPGTQLKLQLAVADVAGFTDADYTGQITLSSSDALATLPAAMNIAAADKGQVQLEVIFRTAGLQTLSAYDAQSGRMLFSQSFQVGFGSATQLALRDLPVSVAAGSPLSGTVAVLDDFNNLVADFTGSVRLACQTESQVDCTPANLPACTFAATDLGKKDCLSAWYLQRQGKSRLGVISLANPALQSPTVGIEVRPVGQPVLRALLPAAVRAGEATTLRLQATDAYGNVNPAYTGTVNLTSSDAQATLPTAVSFTAADAGVKVLERAAIFRSAGPQQLRLAASNAIASSTTVEVLVGAVRQVNARALSPNAALRPLEPEVSLSASDMQHQVAVPGAVQIWVSDTYGNRDRGFAGYVSLTACASPNVTSCPSPIFSANVNFSPNDLGVKRATLPLLWQISGSYSLIARALGQETWLGSRSNLQVISGPPASYSLTSPSNPNSPLEVVAGSEMEITLTGFDLYGNLAIGPAALSLTSNDANVLLLQAAIDVPAGAPLQLTLPAIFRTAGSRTLTLQQRNSLGNLVEAGPLASLAVSVLPASAALVDLSLASSAQAGAALAVTLAAKDLYGNLVPIFMGNVLLSSSDALATLPGTPLPPNNPQDRVLYRLAFTEAEGGFKHLPAALLLRSAGAQQLEAWLEGSESRVSKAVTVSLGSSRFAHALPALPQGVDAAAGEPVPLRFLVADGYGNIDTQFSGTLAAYTVGQLNPIAAQLHPGDGGSVVVPNGFVFPRAGTYSLRTEFSGSSSLAISPGFSTVRVTINPQRTVQLHFLSEPVAGSPLDAEAWISDAYGNLDSQFAGTVNLAVSDANGSFPASITFTSSDNGWKLLPQSFVFRTAGSQSLSLTLAASQPGVSSSTQTLSVAPAAPAAVRHALMAGPLALTQLLAGGTYDLELRVEDSYGNPITNQNTPVFLSCSDVNAQFPTSVILTGNELGMRRLPAAVSLRQAGSHSLSSGLTPAADAYQTNYTVIASSQRYAYLTLLSPLVVKDQPATIEVRIADAYRNVSTEFVGNVLLTGQGTPQFGNSTLTFSQADLGVKTTSVVFANSGNYSLNTSLPLGSDVVGRSLSLSVQAPSAVRYLNLVANSNSLQAGQAGSLQLYVTKQSPANPNLHILDTNFTGSVTLSTSDANASFNQAPGQAYTYTFQSSDNGNALLANALRLRTAGTQSITASSDNPSHQPSTAFVSVTPSSNRFANLNPLGSLHVGQPFSLQVYITDDYGNLATDSPNTILLLQSSDTNASLPGPIPLTSADQGNKLIPSAVTFYQSGAQSLTLNGNDITTGSASLNLAPGPIATTTLSLSSQSPQTGQAITFQVNAFDSYSNLVTTANSNLQLTVSDAVASYPASFSLQSGTYSGSLIFRTTGPQSVSLRLPGSGTTLSQVNLSVSLNSERYAHAALGYTPSSMQTTVAAGALAPLQVWVGDAYGNIDSSFTGTLSLQSSDPLASLPASVSIGAADAGFQVSLSTTRLRRAGLTTLSATGAGLSSFPRSVTVVPGAQQFLYARPITNPNAGQPASLNVWAADSYGNLVTTFAGNANLTSSDALASLPSPVSFNAAASGNLLLTDSAVFRTAGSQTLSTTSALNSGSQSFSVGLGSSRFAYAVPSAFGNVISDPQIGSPYDLRVYVADAYSNVDAEFTGTLLVSSSDTNIQLASSGNYLLAGADAGQRALAGGVTFGSAGTQSLVARVAGQSPVSLRSTAVTVRSGAIARYTLAVSNANVQAGQGVGVTITAYDSVGNVATSAPSTSLALIPSDANATVTGNLVLNQGYGTFANAVVFRTSGAATLSLMPAGVVGGVSPLATVSINVLPASLAVVRMLVPTITYQGIEIYDDSMVPNTLSDLVVRLQDAYGNVLTSYAGSLQITSNPSGLVPSNLSAIGYSKNDPNGMRLPQAVQMTFLGSGTITARESLTNVTGTYSLRSRQLAALGEGSAARHTCAILYDGRMKCWGLNNNGQLGYGDGSNRGNSPGQMATNLPFLSLATSRQAVAAALGQAHSCVLLDTGALQCWGYNWDGELGLGDMTTRTVPPSALNLGSGRRATGVTAGMYHTCTLLDNKSASCWGANGYGQLGLGDTGNRYVAGLLATFPTGRTVSKIVAEHSSTCALLDTAQVTCWGAGDSRLGLGDTITRTSPPQTSIALAAGRTVLDVSPGGGNPCVLYDNRDMTCWGYNGDGRLGLGDTSSRGSSANQMGAYLPNIALGTGRKALALNYGGDASRSPLLDTRALVSWGYNGFGNLGLGITGNRGISPSHMGAGLLSVNLGQGQLPVRISSSNYNGATCAILSSDSLKCWGTGADGALGLGDTTNRGFLATDMGDNLPIVPLLAPTPWNPAHIAPLVWLDANSNETLAFNSGVNNANVRIWSNKGSAAVHSAAQTTEATAPRLVSNARNALPAVRFNGTNNYLGFSTAIEATRTVMLAMRWNSSANYSVVLGGFSEALWEGGLGNLWFSSTSATANVINGAAYRNGLQVTPATLTRTLDWQLTCLTTTANTRLQNLGNDRFITGRYFDGDIGEVLVFNYVLTDMQRQRLEGYLAQKWDLASSLVAGHPFIAAAPTFN